MRVLTISLLISQKSFSSGKSEADIARELAAILGITTYRLHQIKRAKSDIKISAEILMGLSTYFSVPIDELINSDFKASIKSKTATA